MSTTLDRPSWRNRCHNAVPAFEESCEILAGQVNSKQNQCSSLSFQQWLHLLSCLQIWCWTHISLKKSQTQMTCWALIHQSDRRINHHPQHYTCILVLLYLSTVSIFNYHTKLFKSFQLHVLIPLAAWESNSGSGSEKGLESPVRVTVHPWVGTLTIGLQ